MRYRLRSLAASSPHSSLFHSLLAAALMLLPADAAERAPKVAPAPPPPVPATIKARRGETTDIPLRIFGTRAQTLTFVIRTAPKAGKLSAPKNVTDGSAVVRYTPPADQTVTRDSFTYAVRSTEGVSAGAEVKIEIVDIPAELIAPAELESTKLLVGESETLTLELTNRGGGVCEGEITVDAPWRVEPPADYRIEANGRAILHVTFAPDGPGEFRGEIHYSSQPDRLTSLSGNAVAALAIRPTPLDLKVQSLTGIRSGAFEITNNTKVEQTIAIHCSERLQLERRLTLAPERSAAITVQTKPDDVEPFAEVIRFSAQDLTAVLPIRAAAVPPPAPPPPLPPSKPAPALAASATPAPSAAPKSKVPKPLPPGARTAPVPEPSFEFDPGLLRIDPMAVTRRVALTPTSITIEWPHSAKPETCHAEIRELALRDKELVISWHRIDDVQFLPTGDYTRAVFSELQPGQAYTLRVVAPIGEDGSAEPVAYVDFITPALPVRPPLVTWPRVLGIVLVILLACVIGARLRARPTGL